MRGTYYTLVMRDEDHNWSPEFGDYDRDCVKDEMAEWKERGIPSSQLKIISSGPTQASINAAVDLLNAAWRNR